MTPIVAGGDNAAVLKRKPFTYLDAPRIADAETGAAILERMAQRSKHLGARIHIGPGYGKLIL